MNTEALTKRINRKSWWHVQPLDPDAFNKRGKFYSSSFEEAEFYGHPGDPERVTVTQPLCGDESHIETVLLGKCLSGELENLPGYKAFLAARFALDQRIKEAAVHEGYDSIALMTPRAWTKFLEEGKMPRSIELNVFIQRGMKYLLEQQGTSVLCFFVSAAQGIEQAKGLSEGGKRGGQFASGRFQSSWATPILAKWAVLEVTTVKPLAWVTAAMRQSWEPARLTDAGKSRKSRTASSS